jgi:NAD(P)H-flavin reductase
VAIASPPSAANASISSFGPRRFILKQRTQQSAPDVQLLEFEPVACSALDPALWLHIPPGQHVSIGLTLPSGEYVKRPYTPVTNARGRFELLVKAYSYGIVSRALHALPVGGAAEVFGPAGRFDFERALRERKHWIMMAQGTGIAPLYQLIKHIRMEATSSASDGAASSSDAEAAAAARHLHMYLLDCNRNESEILLRDELAQLQADSQGKLAVQHVLSKVSLRALLCAALHCRASTVLRRATSISFEFFFSLFVHVSSVASRCAIESGRRVRPTERRHFGPIPGSAAIPAAGFRLFRIGLSRRAVCRRVLRHSFALPVSAVRLGRVPCRCVGNAHAQPTRAAARHLPLLGGLQSHPRLLQTLFRSL